MAQEPPATCDHDWDQTLRCKECGVDKHDHETPRFSGGAGASRQLLSDEDYKREMRKLQR